MDEGFSLGAEGGDAEGHGDAVIAAGIDGGPVEGLSAGHIQAIFEFLDFGTHGAEILHYQGDAVRFLDAELFGVADADAAAGVGRDGGENRQLIDELSGERAANFC